MQCSLFPFFQISHHTFPLYRVGGREVDLIVVWLERLQTKHFYSCTRIFMEYKSGLNNTSVVAHKSCSLGKNIRQIVEDAFLYVSVFIYQQFAVITFCPRELDLYATTLVLFRPDWYSIKIRVQE